MIHSARRLGICLVVLMLVPAVHAQLNRTFVASYGADTNDCSRTTPCRSFSTAITHTNAGGEILVIDSAGYGPTLLIDKSVSVISPFGVYGGMTGTSGTSITINAPSGSVLLRGLTLNSQGATTAIEIDAADRVLVDKVNIDGYSYYGIYLPTTARLDVLDSVVRRATGIAGIETGTFGGTDTPSVLLENVRFVGNNIAFRGWASTSAMLNNVTATGGVWGPGCRDTCQIFAEKLVSSFNSQGVFAWDTSVMKISNSTITFNVVSGLSLGGGTVSSRGNNSIENNGGVQTPNGSFTAR